MDRQYDDLLALYADADKELQEILAEMEAREEKSLAELLADMEAKEGTLEEALRDMDADIDWDALAHYGED